MTEVEWLTSNNPARMLEWLNEVTESVYGFPAERSRKPSDRKLRLFACACARNCYPGEPSRDIDFLPAIERSEKAADAGIPPEVTGEWIVSERNAGFAARMAVEDLAQHHPEQLPLAASILRTIVGNPFKSVTLPNALPKRFCRECQSLMKMEANHHHQLGLWRCLKDGKHVTSQVTVDEMRIHKNGPCPWLTHADGCVPKLAQVIYDERRWGEMGMLADALEEAGCRDGVILRWCRGDEFIVATDGTYRICERCLTGFPTHPEGRHKTACPKCGEKEAFHKARGWIPRRGPSVRGDWVIDLLLGKK